MERAARGEDGGWRIRDQAAAELPSKAPAAHRCLLPRNSIPGCDFRL